MVDLCVINSWILYRGQKKMPMADFKLAISQALIELDMAARGDAIHAGTPANVVRRASQLSADCRFDNFGHPPKQQDCLPQRCNMEHCSRRSKYLCVKCRVYLCVDQKSHCFYRFHVIAEKDAKYAIFLDKFRNIKYHEYFSGEFK